MISSNFRSSFPDFKNPSSNIPTGMGNQMLSTPKESQKTSAPGLSLKSSSFGVDKRQYEEREDEEEEEERIAPKGDNFAINFSTFKVAPCPYQMKHNQKQCVFFHNFQDKRRPHFDFSIKMCPSLENGDQCVDGDDCQFSHNRVEQLYKPENYKTKFCFFYPKRIEECEYGFYCSFAHNDTEILIPLLHKYEKDENFFMLYYKTIWCPFSSIKHNRGLCVYAHNWQDFRRTPNEFNYMPQPCAYWNSTKFITNYDDCCPQKIECNMCHGWKEIEYHPFIYKTKPCMNKSKCKRDNQCPYFHSEADKRRVRPDNGIQALRERHPLSSSGPDKFNEKGADMKGFIEKLLEDEIEGSGRSTPAGSKTNRDQTKAGKTQDSLKQIKLTWIKNNLFTGPGVK